MKKKEGIVVKSTQLFFTSIVLMLLLIVGLSTATFAWFSASSRVGSGAIIFEARNTASASIFLAWNPSDPLDSISFAAPKQLDPMIPKNVPVMGVTTTSGFVNSFRNATISPDDEPKFNENGFWVSPYVAYGPKNADLEDMQNHFYVVNGASEATNVAMQVIFEGDSAELLRVAMFVDGFYVGTVRPYEVNAKGDTHYGEIIEGGDPSTDAFEKVATDLTLYFPVGGMVDGGTDHYRKIEIVCWFDGVWLTEAYQEMTAEMTLVFRVHRGAIPTP